MHCPACGQENEDEFRFCTTCGVDLRALKEGEQAPSEPLRARLSRIFGRSRRERLITLGTVLALLVAIAAFIALDAGGEDEPLDDPYTLAADQRCVEAKGAIARRTQRNLNDPQGVAAYASDISELVSTWRRDHQALAPPPERAAEASALSAALLEVNGEFAALAGTARDGGDTAEQAAAVDAATAELEQAIADLGLAQCEALGFTLGSP